MYSEMRVTTDQKNVRKICRITISFKSLNKCANRPNASLRKTSEGAARSGAAQLNELVAVPYRKGIQETPVVAGIRVRIERLTRYDLTQDRKSTRLNSSHLVISYAVFCLKKKKTKINTQTTHKKDQ